MNEGFILLSHHHVQHPPADHAAAATVQRSQCAHHTQVQVKRKEKDRDSISGWGLLGGRDWQGLVEGIWPGHRGYNLYEKCHETDRWPQKESGPQFYEWCFFFNSILSIPLLHYVLYYMVVDAKCLLQSVNIHTSSSRIELVHFIWTYQL